MSDKPTVYIIDDDPAMRRLVTSLISSIDLAVEAFESPRQFLSAFDPRRTGCVLLDVRMPGMSGLELQRELRERALGLPVIFISGHADVQMAVCAMKAGAADFIEKPFNNDHLLDRVQKAVADSLNSDRLQARRTEIERRLAALTPRERQVLDLVALGETNRAVAKRLAISQRTVEIHRAKVMEKMRAGSLAELVRMVALLDFWQAPLPEATIRRPARPRPAAADR